MSLGLHLRLHMFSLYYIYYIAKTPDKNVKPDTIIRLKIKTTKYSAMYSEGDIPQVNFSRIDCLGDFSGFLIKLGSEGVFDPALL